LNVENDRGIDKYSVNLQVRGELPLRGSLQYNSRVISRRAALAKTVAGFDFVFADPVSMATVIGVIIGCLILLVIVVLIILYAFKAEKWCFSRKFYL
jgi:hypothetical protein